MTHTWTFFRAGGVDQVSITSGADLRALKTLDQKLWVALAMPTRGPDIDPATLALVDVDGDGRIRVPDLLATVAWVEKTLADPALVLDGDDTLALDAIADGPVRDAARWILAELDKQGAAEITLAEAVQVSEGFDATPLNGDGVVVPASAGDAATAKVIEDVLATTGGVPDRSGAPGVDRARLETFGKDVEQLARWARAPEEDPALRPLGAGTEAAASALAAIRAKAEDFYARCRLGAFDARAAAALDAKESDFAALSGQILSASASDIERLPLARIEAGRALPLGDGVNPAWTARVAAFAAHAVAPLLGVRDQLSEQDFATVVETLAPFLAWQQARPETPVASLGAERIAALAGAPELARITALLDKDEARAGEHDAIAAVVKLLRLQRDLGRVLRNFVNFSDFYGRRDGAFQSGTLYLDGRACRLCMLVADAGKHAALASMSSAFLVYCDITRAGETDQIVAAVTSGDGDYLFVGRNGVFYDRKGQDWDATITKVISNPLSIRQAFWAPYRKLVRMIEEQIAKRASDADAAADAKVAGVATQVSHADQAAAAPATATATAPAKKTIDVGTVAAIGVAIGGIGAMVVGILSAFLGLGAWMPLGLAALLLLVSGPSMLLAWLKLRQRNLGPILDASGWAINGRARINVAFGAALTDRARLPRGARRSVDDPYADRRPPWRLYALLALLLVLGGSWFAGKLDPYLPASARSTSVLGAYAPAAPPPAETPPAAPAPTPAAP
jgi:hypothetical protein